MKTSSPNSAASFDPTILTRESCPGCNLARSEWPLEGCTRGNLQYCCEDCAEGRKCSCADAHLGAVSS
jgi:hypothetical protein